MSFVQCPKCGGYNTGKHGSYPRMDGTIVQRYECRDCRTASGQWLRFALNAEHHSRVPRVMVLDIETAPMRVFVWGLYKQRISHRNVITDWHLLSWSAKWLNESETMSDVLTPKEARAGDDKRIADSIWKLLDRADVVIAHNGKRFDIRKLNARFLVHGIAPPMPYSLIDTLRVAQSQFALSSHKQDYMTRLLKLPQKLDTDFQLWIDCVNGDATALSRMEEYNRGDVAGLEEMYYKLRPWIKSHPNMGIYVESDRPVCPACGSASITRGGYYVTPAGRYRAFRCECGAIGRERLNDLSAAERAKLIRSVAR